MLHLLEDILTSTAPKDYIEGIGAGESLDPPSLYTDQLKKRLAAIPTIQPTRVPTPTSLATPTKVPTATPTKTPTNRPTLTHTPIPTATHTPTKTPLAQCATKSQGDANCDGQTTTADFTAWAFEFVNRCSSNNLRGCGEDLDKNGNPIDADFNSDDIINVLDYVIWRNNY